MSLDIGRTRDQAGSVPHGQTSRVVLVLEQWAPWKQCIKSNKNINIDRQLACDLLTLCGFAPPYVWTSVKRSACHRRSSPGPAPRRPFPGTPRHPRRPELKSVGSLNDSSLMSFTSNHCTTCLFSTSTIYWEDIMIENKTLIQHLQNIVMTACHLRGGDTCDTR